MLFQTSRAERATGVVLVDPSTGNSHGADNPVPVAVPSPISVAPGQVSTVIVSIAAAASLSAGVDLGTARVGRITMPAAWDAADLTFQVSNDNVTWNNLHDAAGAEYKVVAAASRSILVPVNDLRSVRYLRVRSGTSAVPVNQLAQRDLVLTLVP